MARMQALLLTSMLVLLLVSHADSEACTQPGQVRLIWGAGPWEGNVQICINGVWGWVCQNSFYSNEAKVVCRQLGFNTTGSVWRRYSYYGWPDPSGPIWLDQLGCHGTETALLNCPRPKQIGDASCNHNALAAVLCQSGGTCHNNDIRLLRNNTGTPFKSSGRVEVCHNSQWGSICDTAWGTPDARVACGQLGYSSTVGTAYCCAQFGPGYGPVWLNNMGCSSSNSNLFSCSHDPIGSSSCPHTKDASASCRGEITTSCTNGNVKLYRPYNGVGPAHDGLALYCNNSKWVAVCDDGWSCHNARLICKKLGYPAALNTRSEYYYGYYKTLDHYRWYCRSTDTDLAHCQYTYRSSCTSLNDQIGVICYSPTIGSACTNGQVRLQNGNTSSEGRVEYCYERKWTPLCSIDGTTASLICKQLGFNSTLATIVNDQRFNRTNQRSVLNHLTCSPTTPALAQCNVTLKGSACFTYVSKCYTEIGIRCHNTANTCTDGQTRLVNGTLSQEGRVEVCLNGIWGAVCQSGFWQSDAYVICKAMGYSGPAPSVYYHSKYGESDGPVMYSNLKCKGWETNLQECTKSTFPNINCSPQNTVGLICKDECTDGDVRLVGGDFDNEGTVEVCMSNLWGLVSDVGWTFNNSKVVCRQLGYVDGKLMPMSGSHYGKPNNMIRLKGVSCSGNEQKLIDCTSKQLSLWAGRKQLATTTVAGVDCMYDVPTDPPCVLRPALYDNAGTDCTNGNVRLQDGQGSGTGRLEYCYNGYWSPFCKMDPSVAQVACRQIGYTTYTWGTVVESGEFGKLMNYSLFDNFTCTGNEARVSDCTPHINTACTPNCPASNLGLRCFNPGVCTTEGAVRLVDGIIENEGRVEVCVKGVWGSVCDQGWDKTDANIVCKQLNYPDTEPIVLANSEFGPGRYPIVYSNTTCGGWESQLTQCNKRTYSQFTCSSNHVAGVLCGYDCNDGDVRLVNGQFNYEGTVEVCYQNIWGLVSDSGWNLQDAQVICRQLGYETTGTMSMTGSHYGKPQATVHMTNVDCDGTEDNIDQCSYDSLSLSQGKTMLSNTDVAGVKCYVPNQCPSPPTGGTSCTSGAIRLTGGTTNVEDGNVEYCYHGYWSPFCYLGPNEATVACRQLGFTSYDMTAVFTDGRFGKASNVSLFQNFSCSNNLAATQLSDCDIVDSCQTSCKNTIGLRCYDSSNCNPGSVRLMDGSSSTEGRLEVCYNNVWGSVCGTNFDVTDAYVVCKELGLGISEPTVYTDSHYGDGDGAIVYFNTSCKGYESSILGCSKQLYGTFSCSRSNVVGIACQEGCTQGDVRLIGGSSSSQGTVEVCYYNTWGLVDDRSWGSQEAKVVCRQLNFQGGTAIVGSAYGKPNAPMLISNTDCTGSERTLGDCQYTQLTENDADQYANAKVAGVRCGQALQPTGLPSSSSSKISPTSIALAVMTVLMVIFLAVSISLVAFMIYIWKKGSLRKRYTPAVSLSSRSASNPLAQSAGEDQGDSDDDDELIQLINE